jgi:uncharacterized protein YdeI (YjbR/CyaY-like superfamily)
VTWRRGRGEAVAYEDAVEEALCFGWVDGQAGVVDEDRSKLYFAPRKRGSGWASSNKARVARLVSAGLMAPSGLAAVERAKADGSWNALDDIEAGIVPPDLQAALDAAPPAARHFAAFSPSARRMILFWISQAKRPETRAARITATVASAARNEKANERPRRD